MTNTEFSLIHKIAAPRVGAAPYPGLLLLHGRGSNEDDLLALGHELDPRLLVVSARAPHILGPGAYYWYDLEASLAGRPSRDSIEPSIGLIEQLMTQSVERYQIDPARFFVGGFSMGGAMTAATMLMHPERVAGGLILSGYVPIHSNLPWKLEDAAGMPVFQAHGTFDDVLPIEFGRMSRDFLTQTPVDLTYREYPIGHTVAPQELADAATWMRQAVGNTPAMAARE